MSYCDHNETGRPTWDLLDARGIYCARVCDKCERAKMREYRADIFTDSNYWHDEPID